MAKPTPVALVLYTILEYIQLTITLYNVIEASTIWSVYPQFCDWKGPWKLL